MYTEDLDLPFSITKQSQDDYIKVRIVCDKDWGAIDWETGELKEDAEVTRMDGAILQLHGGGFIFGSSADCGLEN